MGDAGAIGSIIEDMVDILRQINEEGNLSYEDLRLSLHILYFLIIDCQKNHIDLCINDEYMNTIEEFISEKKLKECQQYVNEPVFEG